MTYRATPPAVRRVNEAAYALAAPVPRARVVSRRRAAGGGRGGCGANEGDDDA